MASTVHPCHTPGLGAWDQVNCYCERAGDPAFWAEPLNALSNLAFIVAALMAYTDFRTARPPQGQVAIMGLILLMMVVGTGSFLFHTFATRWAGAADVAPIGLFIFAYVALAYRWFVGLHAAAAFAVAVAVTVATFAMPPWFNGSALYFPAIAILIATAVFLYARSHAAAPLLLSAAAMFTISLTFRTIDRTAMACGPHTIGSHWGWHLLNAVTLYLLVRAAIQNPPAARER